MNNLLAAVRPLVSDFFPTIIFAVLIAMKVDVRAATGAALVIGIAQVALQRYLKRKVDQLQWASLGLVVVFGTLGLVTNDPRFLMAKPTIIYTAIGAVMLKRGWMLRYLPPIARGRAEPMMVAFGYVWAGLMFATALANLAVAVLAPDKWPAFIAVVPLASKIALFAVQYLTIRVFVRRRVLADMAAGGAQTA
ncbi:septation protein IspZ [Phenylobacterium sp.]|uniref:inner membrane-spanning protein YciB n=1 Tax=Phenylobacterium sp. TaxID=1871053 RepID=UPI00286D1B47|nr:septation protein IspZ [Phenylobacterium sp.]